MTLRKLIREFSSKFIDVHDIDWSAKEGRVFLNLNLFGMYLLLTDLGFVSSLRRADYIHIDGIGAAFLIKVILGISYKPIGYRKWGHLLLEQSEHHGVIFIGGTQRESELAICRVRQLYNITNIQIFHW